MILCPCSLRPFCITCGPSGCTSLGSASEPCRNRFAAVPGMSCIYQSHAPLLEMLSVFVTETCLDSASQTSFCLSVLYIFKGNFYQYLGRGRCGRRCWLVGVLDTGFSISRGASRWNPTYIGCHRPPKLGHFQPRHLQPQVVPTLRQEGCSWEFGPPRNLVWSTGEECVCQRTKGGKRSSVVWEHRLCLEKKRWKFPAVRKEETCGNMGPMVLKCQRGEEGAKQR